MNFLRKYIRNYQQLSHYRDYTAYKEFMQDNLQNVFAAVAFVGIALLIDMLLMIATSSVPFSRVTPVLVLEVFFVVCNLLVMFALNKEFSRRQMAVIRWSIILILVTGVNSLAYHEIMRDGSLYVYIIALFLMAIMLNFRLREIFFVVIALNGSVAYFLYTSVIVFTSSFVNPYRYIIFASIIVLPVAVRTHINYMLHLRQCAELEMASEIDPLTGMFNRRGMEAVLMEKNYKHSVCACVMDVDDFKSFNDTYGHSAGDDCLRAVSENIRKMSEKIDSIAIRLGGEEFAIIFFTDDKVKVSLLVKECLKEMRMKHILSGDVAVYPYVTLSAGLAISQGGMGKKIDKYYNLLSEADKRLYRAKMTGKNCLVE